MDITEVASAVINNLENMICFSELCERHNADCCKECSFNYDFKILRAMVECAKEWSEDYFKLLTDYCKLLTKERKENYNERKTNASSKRND